MHVEHSPIKNNLYLRYYIGKHTQLHTGVCILSINFV